MTVKRYTPTQCCEHDGTYVTYSDYQKLVAENVAMRNALSGVMTHCPINDPDIDKACAAMICNDALQSTLATDAAIAEIEKRAIPPYVVSIIDSGELESICWQSPHSESEHARLAIYNWRQQREKVVNNIIYSMAGSGSKAARRAANLRAGRKG